MTDCRLTNAVGDLIAEGGEIHSEVAIRMPDGRVYKVHHDGSTEFLFEVSHASDDDKLHLHYTSQELAGPFG
jgi:hypothetical protein